MTVTCLCALETTNDRKGYGICIFSNKPASLKCCLGSKLCSAYPGVRGDTERTSLLTKKSTEGQNRPILIKCVVNLTL